MFKKLFYGDNEYKSALEEFDNTYGAEGLTTRVYGLDELLVTVDSSRNPEGYTRFMQKELSTFGYAFEKIEEIGCDDFRSYVYIKLDSKLPNYYSQVILQNMLGFESSLMKKRLRLLWKYGDAPVTFSQEKKQTTVSCPMCCSVCLSEKDKKAFIFRICGHPFCVDCSDKTWQSPCPICRATNDFIDYANSIRKDNSAELQTVLWPNYDI
jgi:hypothetical protein